MKHRYTIMLSHDWLVCGNTTLLVPHFDVFGVLFLTHALATPTTLVNDRILLFMQVKESD